MATRFDFQQRYDQLIEMNEQAFQDGLLNLAYHTLFAAYQCASEIGSSPLMKRVGSLAQNELDWIDQNQSSYWHSTRSTAMRHGGVSIFKRLSNLATRGVEMQGSIQRMRDLLDK